MHKIINLFSVICHSFQFISSLFLMLFNIAIYSSYLKYLLQSTLVILALKFQSRIVRTIPAIEQQVESTSIFALQNASLCRAGATKKSCRSSSFLFIISMTYCRMYHALTTYVRMRSARIPPTTLPAVITRSRIIISIDHTPAT